jgi:ABC-2 type transport system permease protein
MTQTLPIMPPGHYGFKHVVKSETVKLLTLRSTAITLTITVAIAGLVTGLVANAALGHNPLWYQGFDPTQSALTGLIVAALTGGVFGALCITGEYGSGTIRASLAATPRRPLFLAAKMAVTAAGVLVFSELLSFACFWLGQAILSGGGAPSADLGSPGALRAVVMTGAFVALLAMMSFGLGLIFRSTAAAIAGFAGVTFVLQLVLRGISERDVRYAPVNIMINSITSTVHPPGPAGPFSPVSPGVGLTLMAVYALAVLGAGAVLFVRRDA